MSPRTGAGTVRADEVPRRGDRLARLVEEPRWVAVALGLLMVLPTATVLLASRRGPGISPDSITYVVAARSFAESGTLWTLKDEPLTLFPPGYPLLLGAFQWAGIDAVDAAVALNAGLVALTVLLTHLLGRVALGSSAPALVAAALVAVGGTTVQVYAMLWSEPLFAVLSLVVLWLLTRACVRRGISAWQVLLVGALVSMATLVRYVGVTLIPVAVLGVAVAVGGSRRNRLAALCILAGVSAGAGLAVAVVRNLAAGVDPFGDRSSSGFPALRVILDSLSTLGEYVVPLEGNPLAISLGLGIATVLVIVVLQTLRVWDRALLVTTGFVVVYWAALFYSEMVTTVDPVGPRFTSPVFAPMVIMCAAAALHARRFLLRGRPGGARTVGQGLTPRGISAVAIWLLVGATVATSLARGARFTLNAAEDGLGYNSRASLDSALTDALAELPADAGIASNEPYRVYWNTGRSPVTPIPRRDRWSPEERTRAAVRLLAERVGSGNVRFLAIFDGDSLTLTAAELQEEGMRVRDAKQLADGGLYEVAWVGVAGPG